MSVIAEIISNIMLEFRMFVCIVLAAKNCTAYHCRYNYKRPCERRASLTIGNVLLTSKISPIIEGVYQSYLGKYVESRF